MIVVNSIADLRALAQRRLPRALFDYIERGSYDELTWARNRDEGSGAEFGFTLPRAEPPTLPDDHELELDARSPA